MSELSSYRSNGVGSRYLTAPEAVYTSEAMHKHGWHGWTCMFAELLDSRELIWRLIVRDISARYRQSILGYFWAIIPVIATVMIFAFLTTSRTIPVGDTPMPYIAYALWSLSVWQFFAGCLVNCTNSLVSAGSLVSKVKFPKETLVIAALGQPLVDFLIRLVPTAFVFTWYGMGLNWQTLFIPFVLVPVMLLALGLGFLFSIANLLLRDIGNGLNVILTLAIFMAPILYPAPTAWPSTLVNVLNPFSPMLIASQDLIAHGTLSKPEALLVSSSFSVLAFFIGWRLFRIVMPRVCAHA